MCNKKGGKKTAQAKRMKRRAKASGLREGETYPGLVAREGGQMGVRLFPVEDERDDALNAWLAEQDARGNPPLLPAEVTVLQSGLRVRLAATGETFDLTAVEGPEPSQFYDDMAAFRRDLRRPLTPGC